MVASAEGLDVSNFQGAFNWQGTSGLSFGAFRLTQGLGGTGTNSPDPQASHNFTAIAKKGGMVRMAYHFLNPDLSGPSQAEYFVNHYDDLGMTGRDCLWLDNETASKSGPAHVAATSLGFMQELDKLVPHNPRGVYTFIDFAKEGNCAGLEHYALWLAYPSPKAPAPPVPWTKWTLWQWGLRNGDDADAFNGTAAQLDGWVGSFAAKPAGPVRRVADGKTSLQAAAGTAKMAVDDLVVLSLSLFQVEANKIALVDYLINTGMTKPMKAGLVYWTSH